MAAILGVNSQHADSSAVLLIDGRLIAAVAEERLGRRLKHDPAFPAQAIRAVLAAGGIGAQELTHIARCHVANVNLYDKRRCVLGHLIPSARADLETRRRSRTERSITEDVAAGAGCDPQSLRATVVP